MSMRYIIFSGLLILLAMAPGRADPGADLKSFSLFKTLDPSTLTPGSIEIQRLGSMSFRRGISVQSCFLVESPLAKTLETLRSWNPNAHPALNVLLHQPINLPVDPTDFSSLKLEEGNRAERWLMEQTSSSDLLANLFLSKDEATQKPAKGSATEISQFWLTVLENRAKSFFSGGLKSLPPDDFSGNSYRPENELRSLLHEMPPISTQFGDLLEQTVFSATPSNPSFAPHPYWELLSIQDEGTLDLGATFTKEGQESSIMVDCQYYANASYFINMIIYQLWPISYQGHDCTFMWRCDLVSSPTLAEYRGIERLAAENLTIQSVKEAIRSFQEDVRNGK